MNLFYPLEFFAKFFTYGLLKISDSSYFGQALEFFIYDSIKIILLITLISFLMAVIRYYLPVERIKDVLTKRRWYGIDYLLAAVLGMITPFCSCSSIPLFLGFVGAGIPLGVTFTFLI
ncbi:permease, partial [Candidatus Dojkabacteria bacterium]|nr:permease [Candidatus Dojkabacteria bacterium]